MEHIGSVKNFLSDLDNEITQEHANQIMLQQNQLHEQEMQALEQRTKALQDQEVAKKFVQSIVAQNQIDETMQAQTSVQDFIDSIHLGQASEFLEDLKSSGIFDFNFAQVGLIDEDGL